ncbi:MAG: glycosyltransferase [Halothece sp. Uz-M2-17]|nr:glycosyltransferase [Halothece sp. Uz-M2-17]
MATSSISLLHTIKDISQDKGGVPIAVIRLLEDLAENHREISIKLAASPGKNPLLNTSKVFPNFNWSSLPEGNNRAFQNWVKTTAQQHPDQSLVIHDHGIWLPCNHAVAVASRSLGIPRIVSPHGMLEPWAWQYKRWKKRLAWFLFQYRDLKTAQVLHATATSEAINLRKFFPDLPIAIIPLGIDLPPAFSCPPKPSKKTLLFLSRIHEKKGLLNLVEAWAQLQPLNWQLIIAGPNEKGYQEVIEKKIQALKLTDSISFPGEVVGEAKWELYRQADLFVLPTLSENFGIVIAEALACETPVMTTKGAPWSELETHRCGWWIDIGVTPLVENLQQAMSLSDGERREMGQRGRMLIESKYTWKETTEQLLELYHWMLRQGEKPSSLID